jgi:FkbM family methyltransferase
VVNGNFNVAGNTINEDARAMGIAGRMQILITDLAKHYLPHEIFGIITYIFYRGQKSYSENGEDIQLRRLLSKKSGFFIDIGAFHPKCVSNTFGLYKRGWRGINVDVDEYKIRLFRILRRRDTSLSVGIGPTSMFADFFYHGGSSYGSMSGFNYQHVARNAQLLRREVLKRSVQIMPLNDLIERYARDKNGTPAHVDFISVDVEGYEFEILKNFDFAKYEVPLLAIEIHGDWQNVMNTNVFTLMLDNDYKPVSWTPPTWFFARKM